MKKTETHDKHKYYRKLLSAVIKKSKKIYIYYSEFFETNMNNIKNAWKGIRSLISQKQSASPYIHLLSQGNETLSNLQKIVNIFNDYFSTIAEKTKLKIGFLNKSFDNFLQRPSKNSFFLR